MAWLLEPRSSIDFSQKDIALVYPVRPSKVLAESGRATLALRICCPLGIRPNSV
jgi:hypothetical protein